jgi:hypothetical protein
VSTAQRSEPIPLRLAAPAEAPAAEPGAGGVSLPAVARLELDAAAWVEAVRGAVRQELAGVESRLLEALAAARSVEAAAPPVATPAEPDWWSMPDLAAGMKVSVATAYRAASRGDIGPQPSRPTPGRVIYDRAECAAWLKCKKADGSYPTKVEWAALQSRKHGNGKR